MANQTVKVGWFQKLKSLKRKKILIDDINFKNKLSLTQEGSFK